MPIYGFSVPDMMGIDEKPGIKGGVIPVERHGVKVINGLLWKKTPVICKAN